MRQIFLAIMAGMFLIGGSHAVLYLDELQTRDVTDDKQIVVNSGAISLPVSDTLVASGTIPTGAVAVSGINLDLLLLDDLEETTVDPLAQLLDIERDAEFLMALRWIYEQGITKFDDPKQFMPDNYLTRVDAAKMLSILSHTVFGTTQKINQNCGYTDISDFDDTTKSQVLDACGLGIFRPAAAFNPHQGITKGQLITVLIRMFDGKVLNESVDPWYKNYVQRAWELGLLPDRSMIGMEDVISRMDVAKLLYKLRNIYLNQKPVKKDSSVTFMSLLEPNAQGIQQALIDVDMIRDDSTETLQIHFDKNTSYYFGKSKVYNYGATLSNFQVFGYLYQNSASLTPVGVGTWRVQQGIIQEAKFVIRGTPQVIYSIVPNSEGSLYLISK